MVCDTYRALVSEFLRDKLMAQLLTFTNALGGGLPLELTLDTWCEVALDVVKGVRYMRRCNLLHRDIRVDNILLVEGGLCWRAHIIDFGECSQLPEPLVLPSTTATWTPLPRGWRGPSALDLMQ